MNTDHSRVELASLAVAAANGEGGCWVVVGAAGPYYCGLHRAPAETLVEAVLTLAAPRRSHIILASNHDNESLRQPRLEIEPNVVWGQHRGLWRFRGNIGAVEMPPAEDDAGLPSMSKFTVQAKHRLIMTSHNAVSWTERMHDLLEQIEIMCGKTGSARADKAVPKGQGLLIIDDGYMIDGVLTCESPSGHVRVRHSRRFQELPKLAADSGTMVVVLTASEERARALLGIGPMDDGDKTAGVNLLRHVFVASAPGPGEEKQRQDRARDFPCLCWQAAHSVHWPSGQRPQPYGEMLRPSKPEAELYDLLRTASPAPLPSPISKLNGMVGMDHARDALKMLEESARAEAVRRRHGLSGEEPQPLHACICGPTGTGKTTLARIIAEIYGKLGLLEGNREGKMILEVSRADLVGDVIGATALKTRAVCERALGGVLFIDEAYSLAGGGERDFGKEAVDELLLWMANYNGRIAVILAGYEDKLDMLWKANEGLRTRIPDRLFFHLNAYEDEDVVKIVQHHAKKAKEVVASDAAQAIQVKIAAYRVKCKKQGHHFGNGRAAKMLLQAAQHARDARVPNDAPPAEYRKLLAADFANARFGELPNHNTENGRTGTEYG